MRIALVTVYSHRQCTLKDVAGGYGTVFDIGRSLPARVLARAKARLAALPSPVLGHLAAIARRAGHEVVPVDVRRGAAGHDPVPDADLALVLSSLVDAAAERDVARELRQRGVRVVVFGAHATMRPDRYADVADAVVRGEPEVIGESLFDRELEGVVDAGFAPDLDALPLPDWDAFPIDSYRYALLTHRGRTLPVAGARGCAYGCGYCPFRVTSRFRERAPARVVEEIRRNRDRYGARGVAFRDPLFNFDRARVRELARLLAPLDVRWSAEMRADRLDATLLEELRDVGLRSLEIGVESADVAMLARAHRSPPSQHQIEHVVDAAHRLGIRVIANFLLGLPADTEPGIRKTVAWAKQLNTFAVQFTVATPYPGTSLESETEGRLVDRELAHHTGFRPVFAHPTISGERLHELREWAYVSYHMRPRYLGRFARQAARALLD